MGKHSDLILVLDSVRSLYNVGSLLRTAEGLGVKTVYALGITPYPRQPGDKRLPHIIERVEKRLSKTALGAEHYLNCKPHSDSIELIRKLKKQGYQILSLEQTARAIQITQFQPTAKKLVLIVGNEIKGVSQRLIKVSDTVIEIPMPGQKSSLNVATAGAIALFYLSHFTA